MVRVVLKKWSELSTVSELSRIRHDLWLEWGSFFLFSWSFIYVSYWFTVICEILRNGTFYFRESWFYFFYFLRFVNLQIFFSSIYTVLDRRHFPPIISFLPLNCHYHQIGFALNTGCACLILKDEVLLTVGCPIFPFCSNICSPEV